MAIAPGVLISATLLITVCTLINCYISSWSLSSGYNSGGSPAGIRGGHLCQSDADYSTPRAMSSSKMFIVGVLEHNEEQKRCIKKFQPRGREKSERARKITERGSVRESSICNKTKLSTPQQSLSLHSYISLHFRRTDLH